MDKPTVLLDCDGVLADFTKAALELIHRVTGRLYTPNQVTTWEIFDSIPEQEARSEVYKILKGEGGCLSIPVYDDALEGVKRLQELANIVIVTSPFKGSPTWAHERELWLDKHFGKYISDVIHAHNKARIHGDFFIDDKPSHIKDWLGYWVHSGRSRHWDKWMGGLLWETDRTLKQEETPDGAIRVRSWYEVHRFVQGIHL